MCGPRKRLGSDAPVYEEFVGKEETNIPLWEGDRGEWDTLCTLTLELPQ